MSEARTKGRRKPRGVQEAVDENDDVRNSLFDGKPPPAKLSYNPDEKEDLQSLTLEQRKDKAIQGNAKSLDNAIAHAAQATQIADQTLTKLDAQKEQLKRSEGGLDDINASMTRSERLINGMKSLGGAFSNWITGGAKHEKSASISYPSDNRTEKSASEAKKNLEAIRARTASLRREGILFELSGMLRKTWNQRYFVLENGVIQYFKDEASYRANEASLAKMPTEGMKLKFMDDSSNGRQFCFSIVWEKPTLTSWMLSANTDKEKRDWLSIVRLVDRSTTAVKSTSSTDPDTAFNSTRIQKPRDKMTDEEKFIDDIDRAREDEDAKLDQLGDLVEGLRFRAQDLGAELESHNQIICRIDGKLDDTNVRIKKNHQDLKALAKS